MAVKSEKVAYFGSNDIMQNYERVPFQGIADNSNESADSIIDRIDKQRKQQKKKQH